MLRSQKRLLLLLTALPILILLASLIYMAGMAIFEGDARTFWQSLAWAAETLSTTGYGADSRWDHPAMVVFVVVLQFAGVFLIFLIFPIYLIPFLEERFEAKLPTETLALDGHVVIVRYTPAVSILLEELDAAEVPVLIAEPDEAEARRLFEAGHRVIFGQVDDHVLERVHLEKARAIVANSSDAEDAAVILSARELGFSGDIFALVEEPINQRPMKLAGATEAFSPKSVLGAVLAARCSRKVDPVVVGVKELGSSLRIAEVRIEDGSELAGRTLLETRLGERTNVTVIGLWGHWGLEAPVAPQRKLDAGSILVVVGGQTALDSLDEISGGAQLFHKQGSFLVVGYGEVGREVSRHLREAGEAVTVIDREAGDGIDVVGNALDPNVLERANAASAQAVLLAVNTDSATLFATVVLQDIAPHVPVFARVNHVHNLNRIHRAGAQFAQALGEVSSHILAERMIGNSALKIGAQLEVMRAAATAFAGGHPKSLGVRERTGCSIVAVERGSEVFTRYDESFALEPGDSITVCGSQESIELFREELAASG